MLFLFLPTPTPLPYVCSCCVENFIPRTCTCIYFCDIFQQQQQHRFNRIMFPTSHLLTLKALPRQCVTLEMFPTTGHDSGSNQSEMLTPICISFHLVVFPSVICVNNFLFVLKIPARTLKDRILGTNLGTITICLNLMLKFF